MLKSVQKEFDRRTETYGKYNFLQKQIAKELISKIDSQPKTVIDLGSGDGEIYKNISWDLDAFTALEFSPNMLSNHPNAKEVTKLQRDFNDKNFLQKLNAEAVLSSSSLQWAQDLESTLQEIAKVTDKVAFSIFTKGTFQTIREIAKVDTHLKSADEVQALIQKYFYCDFEVKNYTLEFNSKRELFTYIKKSGVSGGRKRLSYIKTKELINNYPTLTLECEVLFAVSIDFLEK